MPRAFRARRKDENQKAIIAGLEACGCTVEDIDGKDRPDIAVGYGGKNFLLEIKNPEGGRKPSKIKPGQVDWHRAWRGQSAIVWTLDEALQAVGILRHDNS